MSGLVKSPGYSVSLFLTKQLQPLPRLCYELYGYVSSTNHKRCQPHGPAASVLMRHAIPSNRVPLNCSRARSCVTLSQYKGSTPGQWLEREERYDNK
jgi:hypothetical protein